MSKSTPYYQRIPKSTPKTYAKVGFKTRKSFTSLRCVGIHVHCTTHFVFCEYFYLVQPNLLINFA